MVVLMIWELSKLLICLLKCEDVYCFRTGNVQYTLKSYRAYCCYPREDIYIVIYVNDSSSALIKLPVTS